MSDSSIDHWSGTAVTVDVAGVDVYRGSDVRTITLPTLNVKVHVSNDLIWIEDDGIPLDVNGRTNDDVDLSRDDAVRLATALLAAVRELDSRRPREPGHSDEVYP